MGYDKIVLVYNGNAGRKDIREQLGQAAGVLGQAARELVLLPAQAAGHTEALCRERGGDCDLLVLLGGDGTVHEGINGLAGLERPPVVGILPAGTCNDFSRALRMPQQLGQAAEAILAGRTQRIDIGRMGDRYFSNFYGIGLIADTSENINAGLKDRFGRLSYMLSALQKVTQAKSFPFRLETDRGAAEGEAVMILAVNGTHIGTNRLPLPDDSLADGKLDVFIVKEAGLPLLKELLASRLTDWRPESADTIDYIQTSRLRLITPEPMKADTDGEIYTETPAELEALPGRLTFAVGPEPEAG